MIDTESATRELRYFQSALKAYKTIHNAASLQDACSSVYQCFNDVIVLDRLFCIVDTEPVKEEPPTIRFASYIETGEVYHLPNRKLSQDEILTRVFVDGTILSSDDKERNIRQLGPELSDMDCWILIPLISSTQNVLGVLGLCRHEASSFSDSEKNILVTIADAITQTLVKQKTIYRLKIEVHERVVNELSSQVFHDLINELGTIPIHVRKIEELIRKSNIQYPSQVDQHFDDIDNEMREIATKARERMKEIKKPLSIPIIETFPVLELIEEILETVDLNQYKLSKEFQPDVPGVRAHRQDLADAFKNIIYNALQAMCSSDRKELNIYIGLWSEKQGKSWVKVEITDTGLGINPEDLPKIWDLSYSTKSPPGGFGLYWTKNVVEECNGIVEVHSRVNVGTTFTINLPVALES